MPFGTSLSGPKSCHGRFFWEDAVVHCDWLLGWAPREPAELLPIYLMVCIGVMKPCNLRCLVFFVSSRAAKWGGGFPDLDLSFLLCPFSSFLGLPGHFWDFPDLLGDGPGIFPICPFPLSRSIKSTYEEQSRKGPRRERSRLCRGPFRDCSS